MKIPDMTFRPIDWNVLPVTNAAGEKGTAATRADDAGQLRTGIVDFSPGYVLDHYCDRGHIVHVLDGELIIDLFDGRVFTFPPGTGLAVSDFGDSAHRIRSDIGARVFIAD